MLNINGELNEINSSKQFNITLNSYEGPIDLLLDLARKQKVDLSEISILELAEQYISFIKQYQDIHLEIARLPCLLLLTIGNQDFFFQRRKIEYYSEN